MTISLGIVGTGAIAAHHIKAIEWININSNKEITIAAAMNRSEASNSKAKEQYCIWNTYQSIDAMMLNEALNGILVLVSVANLFSVVCTLIPFGVPLLIEKPPGLSKAETTHLSELAHQYGTKVMVGFNRRFYSIVKQAKEIVLEQGGLLGMRMDGFERYRHYSENLNVTKQWLDSLLMSNTIHCIDLIRHYSGNVGESHVFNNILTEEPFNHRYTAMLVSERQVPITFQAYWHSFGNWSYELYFSDGKIHFVNLEEAYVYQRNKQPIQLVPNREDIDVKAGFVSQMLYFIDEVISKEIYEGELSIKNAIGTMELIEKINN